jgi:hypothetical protein
MNLHLKLWLPLVLLAILSNILTSNKGVISSSLQAFAQKQATRTSFTLATLNTAVHSYFSATIQLWVFTILVGAEFDARRGFPVDHTQIYSSAREVAIFVEATLPGPLQSTLKSQSPPITDKLNTRLNSAVLAPLTIVAFVCFVLEVGLVISQITAWLLRLYQGRGVKED